MKWSLLSTDTEILDEGFFGRLVPHLSPPLLDFTDIHRPRHSEEIARQQTLESVRQQSLLVQQDRGSESFLSDIRARRKSRVLEVCTSSFTFEHSPELKDKHNWWQEAPTVSQAKQQHSSDVRQRLQQPCLVAMRRRMQTPPAAAPISLPESFRLPNCLQPCGGGSRAKFKRVPVWLQG